MGDIPKADEPGEQAIRRAGLQGASISADPITVDEKPKLNASEFLLRNYYYNYSCIQDTRFACPMVLRLLSFDSDEAPNGLDR